MNQNLASLKSDYLKLYNYILQMDGNQIWKLRKIATGILPLQAFSEDEIRLLEARTISQNTERAESRVPATAPL